MKKRLWIVLAVVLVVIAGIVGLLMSRQVKGPVLVSRTDPAKIRFEEYTHDLGTVAEGVEIPYTFTIRNVGGEPLVIKDVTTSCGCTLLNLKDKVIAPGKSGSLEVVMDTAMKQGYVKKSIMVTSNDPKHPQTEIFLSANIQPSPDRLKENLKKAQDAEKMGLTPVNPHAGLGFADTAKIFTGKCAVCHVQVGKGKLGGDLFQADCAMCHGKQAEGAVGPALVPGDFQNPAYVGRMKKIIRYGSPTSVTMPGFLDQAGGPLTEGEIDSVVQYLQQKSDHVRQERPAQ